MTLQTGTTLTFERFWRWLRDHRNCVMRAGGMNCWLYDAEDLHWSFEEESGRAQLVQLSRGKQLLAELIIDPQEVLFVQATPDPEAGEKNAFLFELVGGQKGEEEVVYHFLIAHGFDEQPAAGHSTTLKH